MGFRSGNVHDHFICPSLGEWKGEQVMNIYWTSFSHLQIWQHTRGINCCETVRQTYKRRSAGSKTKTKRE